MAAAMDGDTRRRRRWRLCREVGSGGEGLATAAAEIVWWCVMPEVHRLLLEGFVELLPGEASSLVMLWRET